MPGAISGADEVQSRADIGGAVGHRAPAARIRTVAFRENLIRRGIKHDERVIVIHVPSMPQAYRGDQSRRSSSAMAIRPWRRTALKGPLPQSMTPRAVGWERRVIDGHLDHPGGAEQYGSTERDQEVGIRSHRSRASWR